MKGIVVKYFEEKGFGFIKDENEEERFFHIKNMINKDKFLSNITDYYFTDWFERDCYVINFSPSQNEKGLCALNINLTQQIFSDKTTDMEFDAKVVDFIYDTNSLTRIVSGIGKGTPAPTGATKGGHGTYRIGYPEVSKELNIYFRRDDDIGWGTINVRELALAINDRSKITDLFISMLRDKLVGIVLTIVQDSKKWSLKDTSVLKV
jgi:hypothetical protein